MLTQTSSPVMDVDWSADGENTDISNSSSPSANRICTNHEMDSFSEEEDFSDEFSIPDSDEERRTDGRILSQRIIQVKINLQLLDR